MKQTINQSHIFSELQLPHELMLYIFGFMDLKDFISISLVNKDWKILSEDTNLWRELGKRDCYLKNENSDPFNKETYKKFATQDITIEAIDMDRSSIKVTINQKDKVKTLKAAIHNQIFNIDHIYYKNRVLLFQGHILKEAVTLHDAKIRDGQRMHMGYRTA